MVIVFVIAVAIAAGGELRIRGKVRKRASYRRHRAILPPCPFNQTIIDDEWALMEAIGKSKYIFTGKVLHVKKFREDEDAFGKRSNLYNVYLRRVLKGDPDVVRNFVKIDESSETLSGSTLVAERKRARESCAPAPRARLSAIFMSDGVLTMTRRGPSPRFLLLTDPLPLTLYHLDRVNAVVKGRFGFVVLVKLLNAKTRKKLFR